MKQSLLCFPVNVEDRISFSDAFVIHVKDINEEPNLTSAAVRFQTVLTARKGSGTAGLAPHNKPSIRAHMLQHESSPDFGFALSEGEWR